jgi:hypothetical protein
LVPIKIVRCYLKRTLLAVLGRGSLMKYPGGPWTITRDLDVWVLGVKRPIVLSEQNDENPNSVIGGGQLQIAAAICISIETDPDLVVFAYGNRSPYLGKDYPSESHVMSDAFKKEMHQLGRTSPPVEVFNEERWGTDKSSGTYQEVHNMLTLANRMGVDEVVFLTVQVHMNRVLGMIAKHLKDPEFESLRNKWRFEITESVLLRCNAAKYAGRINMMFGSQSFVRNLGREHKGLEAMYNGVTQTKQLDPSLTNK